MSGGDDAPQPEEGKIEKDMVSWYPMDYCSECGAEVEGNQTYCLECGVKIDQSEDTENSDEGLSSVVAGIGIALIGIVVLVILMIVIATFVLGLGENVESVVVY